MLSQLKAKRNSIISLTSNGSDIEEDYRRTCSSYESRALDKLLSKAYQEYANDYHHITSLYHISANYDSVDLFIYDTESEMLKRKEFFEKWKHYEDIHCTHLPNGELFCFGARFSPFIINKDYQKRYPPSKNYYNVKSAIYFKRNVYCFGENIYGWKHITPSWKFNLDENRWIEFIPMPWSDHLGNSIVFKGNIMISGDSHRNLLIYSIDLNSFSTISYEFGEHKIKILAKAKERVYLIECRNGSVYESGVGDEYSWQWLGKSIINFDPYQFDYIYNKGKIYILAFGKDLNECFKFDLDQKVLIDIAYYNKRRFFRRVGSNLQAIECYDQAFKLDPNHSAACINKEFTLRDIGDKLEIIGRCNEDLKLYPKNDYQYITKGFALRNLGKNLEAIECYNLAINFSPRNEYAYMCKGDALCDLGRNLEGIDCYNQSIKLNSLDNPSYYFKGCALHSLGRNIEAIDNFNKAIRLYNMLDNFYKVNRNYNVFSTHDPPFYFKGNALYELDKKLDALECYNKGIKYDDCGRCYLKKGNLLHDLGRDLEAMECYHEAIKLDLDDPLYLTYRAHLFSNLGQRAESLLDCKKANHLIIREISINPYLISLDENDELTKKTLFQCRVESIQALVKLQDSIVEFKDKIQKLIDEIQKLNYKSLKNSEIFEKIEIQKKLVQKRHWELLKRAANCLLHYKNKPKEAIIQIKKEANELQKAANDAVSQLRLLFYAEVINYLDS